MLEPVTLLRSPTAHSPFPASVALQDQLRSLFFLELGDAVYVQLIVTAGFILFLLASGSVLVLHRIVHKRFWLIRLTRRSEGVYLVPNALNCFLVFEACFGVLLVAFNFITWQLFDRGQERYIAQIQAWRLLPWIPLYIGAFLAGWGSFYTAPGALDRRGPRPIIVNVVCLGMPVVLAASLIAPVILAQRQMDTAYAKYTEWLGLAPTLPLSEATQQASAVWDSLAKSYYYEAIGFAVWSFWAIVFLAFYIPAGGYLVLLLARQVKRQKSVLVQQALPPPPALEARTSDATAVAPLSPLPPDMVQRDVFFPPLRSDEKKRFRRLSTSAGTPASKFHYLRRCLVNLVILYAAVIAAAVIFTFITVRLAAREYESALLGPEALADLIGQSDLLAAYASCLFGFLSVGSIWLRNFDPGASGTTANGAGGSAGKRQSKQEKTRTLPPVPESVGVDTSMDRSWAGFPQKGTIQLALVREDELLVQHSSPGIPECESFQPPEEEVPAMVVRRSQRESAASRIAREWQTDQYTRAPLPSTPRPDADAGRGMEAPMRPSPPRARRANVHTHSPGVPF